MAHVHGLETAEVLNLPTIRSELRVQSSSHRNALTLFAEKKKKKSPSKLWNQEITQSNTEQEEQPEGLLEIHERAVVTQAEWL